jgi:hypothetical protein
MILVCFVAKHLDLRAVNRDQSSLAILWCQVFNRSAVQRCNCAWIVTLSMMAHRCNHLMDDPGWRYPSSGNQISDSDGPIAANLTQLHAMKHLCSVSESWFLVYDLNAATCAWCWLVPRFLNLVQLVQHITDRNYGHDIGGSFSLSSVPGDLVLRCVSQFAENDWVIRSHYPEQAYSSPYTGLRCSSYSRKGLFNVNSSSQ